MYTLFEMSNTMSSSTHCVAEMHCLHSCRLSLSKLQPLSQLLQPTLFQRKTQGKKQQSWWALFQSCHSCWELCNCLDIRPELEIKLHQPTGTTYSSLLAGFMLSFFAFYLRMLLILMVQNIAVEELKYLIPLNHWLHLEKPIQWFFN